MIIESFTEELGTYWYEYYKVFSNLVCWDILQNNMPLVTVLSLVDKNNKFKIQFTGGNLVTAAYAKTVNRLANLVNEDTGEWEIPCGQPLNYYQQQ